MATKILTGKMYFYSIGMRCRTKGISKDAGMELYKIDAALPYARIAFDAGYRGLAI
jgi:hypothetical protein